MSLYVIILIESGKFNLEEAKNEIEVTDKHGKKIKIKYIPFKNLKLAHRYTRKMKIPHVVFNGEKDEFWIVHANSSTTLKHAGYELAPKL